ncbi:MAG: AAA family ATPase, partial [Treponema sp.]|nr:AAA family ATPase [Treponema sp.]
MVGSLLLDRVLGRKHEKRLRHGIARLTNRYLVLALVTDGHILLEGVPGLAKTLSCNTLAKALGLEFRRISFTPDLLPADVVGTLSYNQREGTFEQRRGPVFTNILIADEINRAP